MQKYTLQDYKNILMQNGMLADTYGEIGSQEVSLLTYGSKEVVPGTLFICKGAAFKKEYLDEAIRRGAICYVSEKKIRYRGGCTIHSCSKYPYRNATASHSF